MQREAIFDFGGGTVYWYAGSNVDEDNLSVVVTTHNSLSWYRDGKLQTAAWTNPPEALRRHVVDLLQRQQWDEASTVLALLRVGV